MPTRRSVAQRVRHVRRLERGHRGRHLRHVPAEARAERAVVRLDLVRAQLVGLRDEAQLLDVQLALDEVRELLDRGALGAGGHHHRGPQRLADAELGLAARGQAEAHGLAHDAHRDLELEVPRAGLGEVAQVHARLGAVEVVVDLVGQEGAERRQQVGDRYQAGVQRAERGRVAVPEAGARAPHVPVRQLVDERRDRLAGARGVVGVEPLANGLRGRVQARERPAVEIGGRRRGLGHVVDVRVEHVEAVRVPELEQELAHGLADHVDRERVAVPRELREEVPAEGVRAVLVDHVPRHDDVAQRLRHLLALGVGDVAGHQAGPVRRAVEQQRRDRQQRVEPAARLVDRLADVVGREARLEVLLVLVRRVPLRERHRAGVEPDVDHLGHAAQRLAARWGRDLDLVHVRPVRVLEADAAEPLELVVRADADRLAGLVAPHRQRGAPVALARDRPVDVVLQPLAEASVLDVLRVPVDRLVGGQQAVAQLRGGDVPGGLGVVDQRRPAAPAVRVRVQVGLLLEQAPASAQVVDDARVGVLDPQARELAHPLLEGAVELDGVDDGDALLLADAEVVLAERDRRVHDAGAVLGADEVGGHDRVALGPELVGGDERERRLVAGAEHVAAVEAIGDPHALAEHRLDARLGEHVAVLGAHVREVGRHRQCGVGEQRPRRGGPGEDLVAGAQRSGAVDDREGDVDARVLDVLVALGDLVRGQRGPAAGAVGHDLVALVQQLAVPHRPQRPPDRLDVVGLQRPVRVLEVDPVPDPLGQPVPVLEVLEDRLAALGVELGDAVALDVVLGLEAELLLDRDLDGQAVAVPAALALDVAPAHRLIAREDVLERAGEHVVRAGPAVGGRRALVEHVGLGARAPADRLAEDVALAPALEDLLLERGEVGLGGQGAERRHGTGDCRFPGRGRAAISSTCR